MMSSDLTWIDCIVVSTAATRASSFADRLETQSHGGSCSHIAWLMCSRTLRSVQRQRVLRRPASGIAGQGGPLPYPPLRRQLGARPGTLAGLGCCALWLYVPADAWRQPLAVQRQSFCNLCFAFSAYHLCVQALGSRAWLVLSSCMQPVALQPGHDLCQQGAPANRLWFLTEGHAITIALSTNMHGLACWQSHSTLYCITCMSKRARRQLSPST